MSTTLPTTELVLLLGCGDRIELDVRIDLTLKIYNECRARNSLPFVFISGNSNEVKIMTNKLAKHVLPSWTLMGEDCSRDTIDNIINSFKIIFHPTYGAKYYPMNDMLAPCDAFPFHQHHIISSSYHLKRIKFIMDTLGYLQTDTVVYHGSDLYNKTRVDLEKRIEDNVEQYKSLILSRCELS